MVIDWIKKRSWSKKRKPFCTCSMCETLEINEQRFINPAVTLIACIIIALFLIFTASIAHAEQIPETVAIRVLIGEAANQGEHGMICVAEVLRRRGSVKGFYGYKAKHVDQRPEWVWQQAKRAWRKSAYTNYTKNATMFENVKAFGKPCWMDRCVEVYRHKDHIFFTERKVRRG